jgi:hypothetical protein
MNTNGHVYVARRKTCADWQALRARLAPGCDRKYWEDAANDYFRDRLSFRYLDPIRVLQESGSFQGEGFSIVAIQCTLIEFLESTLKGLSYRFLRRGEQLGQYEYSNSSDLFVAFLCERQPFAKEFGRDLAQDFYEGVRCGLLHEARTKKDWTIWAVSPLGTIVCDAPKRVYRDNFQAAILQFVEWYCSVLPADAALQEAFIRKFDSLCT